MHHHHREDGLGTSGYLSANRGNQWILAILPQCQSFKDAGHGSARRLWSRYIADAVKHRMHFRQKVSHLLANMLRIFNTGFQSSGLRRRRHSTQFGSNFKKCKTSISKKKQPWQTLVWTREKLTAQEVESSLQALLKAFLLRLSFGLALVVQLLSLRLVSSKLGCLNS
jgi:hypothetical protein